ncbi:MAG: LapA family protein [Pseudomonadota bacterium]
MKYLMWLLKAAIFFTLFAFALNNQQAVGVHFFFGTLWTAPLVLVVLAAFSCGLALGVLMMMPRWWRKRKMSRMHPAIGTTVADNAVSSSAPADSLGSIPRHGL